MIMMMDDENILLPTYKSFEVLVFGCCKLKIKKLFIKKKLEI